MHICQHRLTTAVKPENDITHDGPLEKKAKLEDGKVSD